jgi:hypothetical protein
MADAQDEVTRYSDITNRCDQPSRLRISRTEVNLHFVVVKRGTEIHQVVDGDAVTATGIKVE